jgi:hypothetical protein
MTQPTQIRIAELDFDQVLQNVITFMKQDPTFADYDFAGSGLRLLARVLAYVTLYNSFYLTQAVNESFLDTAQLRSSVASLARMVGYEIRGMQSARTFANVVVQLTNTSASQITLPLNTPFSLQANGQVTFYNIADAILTQNASTLLYQGVNVELVEGTPQVFRFTVDLTNPTQQFVIPNANVDYTTITVQVQDSISSNNITNFIRNDNFLTIGPTDPVFFVRETFDAQPELTFGNGVVGRPVQSGNIIIANYYISTGNSGNNIRGPFGITSANLAGFVRGVTVVDGNTAPSTGGLDAENIDDVRFLAPLVYQTQNRCVTADDYKMIILQQFGDNIAAINVFGGEQGDPNDPLERPALGHVFIVLKPTIGLFFTDVVRQQIEQNIVAPRSIVGVIPEVIDPDYIYIVVSTSVKYDPKATTLTSLQLTQNITNSITTYAQNNVEKFNTTFRFSKFNRVIDDTDDSILSSLTRLDLEKRIYPALGATNQYVLKYGAPIRRSGNASVVLQATDHRFTYTGNNGVQQANCFFLESNNALSIAYLNSTSQVAILTANVGTVDTGNGVITLTNFAPVAIENNEIDIRISITPLVNDLTPRLNQLFTLDPTEISVQLLNDATATLADQVQFFSGGILP